MRPIKLTMSAFGPYAKEQSLDMDLLGKTGLYAITGETGAGKTTIFDAIKYALYGEGSGQDRNGKNLRSVYADEKTESFVELVFSCGGKEYFIRRSPAQRLRGNKTETPAKVSLRCLPDGKAITKLDEVNQLIKEEIIGVDSDQFSQIVMIAQGEFRKLIQAKSEGRTEILRRIFKTESYDQLAMRLAEASKAKFGEYNDTRKEILSAVKNLRTDGASPFAEQLAAIQSTSAEALSSESALELAQAILAEDEECYSRAVAEKTDSEKARDAARTAYDAATEADRKRSALKQLKTDETALMSTRDAQAAEKEQAEAAQPEIEALREETVTLTNQLPRYPELAELEKELSAAEKAFVASDRAEKTAAACLTAIEEEKGRISAEAEGLKDADQRKGQAELALSELNTVYEKLSSLSARLDNQNRSEKDLAQAAVRQQQAREDEQEAGQKFSAMQEELAALGNTALALSTATQKLKDAGDEAEVLRKRLTLCSDWQTALARWQKAAETYSRSSEKAESDRALATTLRHRYNDNIAGILAAGLEDERPCPVCGSVHHPRPAVLTEAIDLKQVEAAEAAATKSEKAAGDDAAACAGKKAEAGNLHGQLAEQLPEIPDTGWKDAIDSLIAENKALQERLSHEADEATAADRHWKEITDTLLPAAQKEFDRISGLRSTADQDYSTAERVAKDAAEEVRKAAEGLMPDGWDADLLQRRVTENTERQQEQRLLISRAEADRKRSEQIGQRLQELEKEKDEQSRLQSDSKAETARQQLLKESLSTRIGEMRSSLPYPTQVEAEGAIREKDSRRDRLEQAIKDAEKALKATEELLAGKAGEIRALEQQLEGIPEQDLALLDTARSNAQAAFERAEKAERAVYTRRQGNLQQQEQMEKKAEEAVRLEREYRMMQDVSATASGGISGQAKISLETYVQMALFDRILSHANYRLRHMSREQYELKRRPVEGSGHQGKTGLDLDVIDHYNGTVREVGTLSGGEGFLASLSLALGMSDTIQASAASAVRLDTMFVDEGFGSLSGNFLKLAMDELVDTAENGHRLIGIISHVDEVKEQMERRIEVTKTPSGGSKAVIR